MTETNKGNRCNLADSLRHYTDRDAIIIYDNYFAFDF